MQHHVLFNKGIGKERTLDKTQALDRFFAGVERRAFKMAELAVGNREEALDIVQDAMLGLVQKYANRPEAEWTPLFYRILQSRIRDWYRRSKTRARWLSWFGYAHDKATDDESDPLEKIADPCAAEPIRQLMNESAVQHLEQAIQQLPLRQQQAFLLRNWEGLDVASTAMAMDCSQGSVKTHYSRAIHSLRTALEGIWP